PAEDEAPTSLLPPGFLAPRIRPLSPRALGAEMNAIASSLYHLLHPSGTPPLLPIPLSTPSTGRLRIGHYLLFLDLGVRSERNREALARSEAYCRALEAQVAVLETHALKAGARDDTLEDTSSIS
nr:hypothetical protein [Tanacetum cinerariifolium]